MDQFQFFDFLSEIGKYQEKIKIKDIFSKMIYFFI